MRKIILKLKIMITNFSRIIMSFLFINVGTLFQNKVQAETIITCYDAGPTPIEDTDILTLKNVLIILVPLAIVIGSVILFIKKKKSKSKEEKKDDKQS